VQLDSWNLRQTRRHGQAVMAVVVEQEHGKIGAA
jgi:hypothetical protein